MLIILKLKFKNGKKKKKSHKGKWGSVVNSTQICCVYGEAVNFFAQNNHKEKILTLDYLLHSQPVFP